MSYKYTKNSNKEELNQRTIKLTVKLLKKSCKKYAQTAL